jgi:protein-arginine kinase activator protein McsA
VAENRGVALGEIADRREEATLAPQETGEGQAQDSDNVDRLELLRRRLRQAVAEEVYEEAARLRDEISRLEEGGDPC